MHVIYASIPTVRRQVHKKYLGYTFFIIKYESKSGELWRRLRTYCRIIPALFTKAPGQTKRYNDYRYTCELQSAVQMFGRSNPGIGDVESSSYHPRSFFELIWVKSRKVSAPGLSNWLPTAVLNSCQYGRKCKYRFSISMKYKRSLH